MKTLTRCSIILLVCVQSGCAIFDGNKIPDIDFVPTGLSGDQRPTVSYEMAAQTGMSGEGTPSEAVKSQLEIELLDALHLSDYFSRVARSDDTADLQLNVTYSEESNPAAMIGAVITGLSLYTIPSWMTSTFELTLTAESANGLSNTYTVSDSATLVQWLPMAFVFPFKNFSVLTEMRKNMFRTLLVEMQKDGLFTTTSDVLASE